MKNLNKKLSGFHIKWTVLLFFMISGGTYYAQETIRTKQPPAILYDEDTLENYIERDYDNEYDDLVDFEKKDYRDDLDLIAPQRREDEVETYDRNLDPRFKDTYKSKDFNYTERVPENLPNWDLTGFFKLIPYLQYVLYVLLFLFIVYIIYRILHNLGYINSGRKQEGIKVTSNDLEENLDQIEDNNFQVLIRKAKEAKDYKRAVRFYYLWVLQRLTEKRMIKWDRDKTDKEYYDELLRYPNIQDQFYAGNYIFDYVWYGDFGLNESEFNQAEKVYLTILDKIR